MTQTAVRGTTGANRLARIADFGSHHANKLGRRLLTQSRETLVVGSPGMAELRTRGGAWLTSTLGLN
jgi:hypothetical protein